MQIQVADDASIKKISIDKNTPTEKQEQSGSKVLTLNNEDAIPTTTENLQYTGPDQHDLSPNMSDRLEG